MQKLKPLLSIKEIGPLRFYSGIVVGIGYGILTNLWFRLSDKAILVLSDLRNRNAILVTDLTFDLYNSLLITLTCATLGFCFTMFIWSSKPLYGARKRTLKMRVSHANSIFQCMLILFVFTKFLTFDTSLKYDGFGIDLKESFGYFPFALPLSIFLYNWLTISRIYKTGKYLLLSGLFTIIFGVIMLIINT
ncbi:hypothetical protein [Maribacter cobaltidurans]|uniref:Uncharacterized protein n=1 Tax=Maribacter cobaltidurans TaxID=1178778 RepID=A0A223V513_9FLAO|nr:hypothetical protein [Maribacter cobaltidurans]ASV30108.1 hypothetical protein CJ263_07640 [Maribacter cobaltidurans]